MKTMRLLALFGLVLAVSGTAGATPVLPTSPAMVFHLTSLDAGTAYLGAAAGTYGLGGAIPLLPPGVAGNNSFAGESSWGIFSVDAILTGVSETAHQSVQASGTTVWTSTPTDRLVGIFWGETDASLTVDAIGGQTIEGAGLKFAIWSQTSDFVLPGQVPSSRDALIPYKYAGIGTPGGAAGASLWLTGVSTPGFFMASLGGFATEFESVFSPNQPVNAQGSAATYLSLEAIAGLGTGSANAALDSDWFWGAGTTADLAMAITTKSLNPTNAAINKFTVSDSDPVGAVPEPVTMFSAFMAISGLGVYIRRRTKVTA